MGNKNKHRPATKPTQVQKVSKETGVEVKDLDRLPQDAIQKIDDLTPDKTEEDELGDILGDTTSESSSEPEVVAHTESDVEVNDQELPSEEESEDPETAEEDETESGSDDDSTISTGPEVGDEIGGTGSVDRSDDGPEIESDAHRSEPRLVGHHPITKKPIYI